MIQRTAPYDRIAEATGPATALGLIERVEACLYRFDVASERGARPGDIRASLRTIGYAPRLTILRVFYGGRDWKAELAED